MSSLKTFGSKRIENVNYVLSDWLKETAGSWVSGDRSKKMLQHWAARRNLKRDVIYSTFVLEPVEEYRGSLKECVFRPTPVAGSGSVLRKITRRFVFTVTRGS
jgi:hypothetical protein